MMEMNAIEMDEKDMGKVDVFRTSFGYCPSQFYCKISVESQLKIFRGGM